MTEANDYAVEMRGITKRFPGVIANDQVDFAVRRGEIHALLGENGAGKSTLMNVLGGLYQAEEGQVFIDGKPVQFNSPRDAIEAGIGMVHQHFMLVATQSVAENLILGQDAPRFYIDYGKIEREIGQLSRQYGLGCDPSAKIWQLSVGEQQRVEVLKMLYHGARILILDEPTAVLTPQEVDALFKTLRGMVASGHTVIFISHKLDEVVEIADRVTGLRRGKVSASVEAKDLTKADLARLMVGREVLFRVEKKPVDPKDVVLSLERVSCLNNRELPALRELSLEVRGGEIYGVAGVAGNGQPELAEVINGLRPVTSGRITFINQNVTNRPTTTCIQAGMAHVPADRVGMGVAPNMSVADNLILKKYRVPPISRGWRLLLQEISGQAKVLVQKFDVKTPDVDTQARLLSGGNMQKLILAREISDEPTMIVAVYPTRGLDVGATEAVHNLLIAERDRGAAILLISEDLDELLSLSDRIGVIFEGRIVGEVPPEDDRVEEIGLLMAGSKAEVSYLSAVPD